MEEKNLNKDIFGEVKKNWGFLLIIGILNLVLGTVGLVLLPIMTITSIVIFGSFMLFVGFIQIIQTFKSKYWQSVLLHLSIGILYMIGGIATILNPIAATMIFTLILAISFIFSGIFRIIISIQQRMLRNWGFSVAGGILTIILGIMIISQWPFSSLWAFGLLISIEMLINGWTNIFLAISIKNI